jgi:hypothetical protein
VSKSFTSRFIKNFLFALAYFVGMFMLFNVVMIICHSEGLLNRDNLINWDAWHYYYIAYNNYESFRLAFFPLFPYFWKMLHSGIYGITLINGFLFIISASLLATVFEIPSKHFLLAISFPSIIFMFVPYSESVFFFASSIALVGMKKQRDWMVFLGLLLASFARPVAYVFVPVAIIMLFLLKKENSLSAKKIFFYALPAIIGLGLIMLLQYSITGDWFAFFHAQQMWKSYLQMPKLPFTSWGGDTIVRLDGSGFLVGIMATVALVAFLLKNKFSSESIKQEPVLFSTLYLAGICWLILFTRGGSMFSLNRFVFATPFFFIAFVALLRKSWRIRDVLIILFLINVYWLLFGNYVHIQAFLAFFTVSVFIMMFFLIAHPARYISRIAYFTCLFGNIAMQIYFYHHFLSKGWVG